MKARKRVARAPRARRPEDLLQVWRGVLLVAIGGAGLAGLGVSYYSRRGDALVTGLFGASVVALLALGVFAMLRVRRLLRAIGTQDSKRNA